MCVTGLLCAGVVFGCLFGLWVMFQGVLAAEASGGWVAVVGGFFVSMNHWVYPVLIGCAGAFPFVGMVGQGNVLCLSDRPLLPIAMACAVVGAHAVLLAATVAAVVADSSGPLSGMTTSARLGAIMLLTLLFAGSVSAGLGRGRVGIAVCTAAVFVFTTLALHAPVYSAVLHSSLCVWERSLSCWGAAGLAAPTAYGGADFIRLGFPFLRPVCCAGAAVDSGLRATAARWSRRRPASADLGEHVTSSARSRWRRPLPS
ncbi:hypothetical protein GCM10009799_24110 [Nocardiopsis rhodophaea]|uniref:Integral membrane protein n=1 Tax=Nocardiopsis rhodophaea TaxID=280238 RepID=A0ABN2T3B7_9ACTN